MKARCVISASFACHREKNSPPLRPPPFKSARKKRQIERFRERDREKRGERERERDIYIYIWRWREETHKARNKIAFRKRRSQEVLSAKRVV